MKFIADVMLGRLAKRMRLLGFDVLYHSSLDDNELIRLSLEQGRMILTRDTALAARPTASNHLFIKSERIEDQVNQVRSAFPADAPPLTRCSRCNEPLILMRKQDVADLVPSYVFETKEEFFMCKACGRIYWRGTHVKRMGLRRAPSPPEGRGLG